MLRRRGQRQPEADGLVVPAGGAPIVSAPVPVPAVPPAVPPGSIGPAGVPLAPGAWGACPAEAMLLEPRAPGVLPGSVVPGEAAPAAGGVVVPSAAPGTSAPPGGVAPPIVAEPTSGPGQGGVAPGTVVVWAAATPAANNEAAANRRMELMACMSHLP